MSEEKLAANHPAANHRVSDARTITQQSATMSTYLSRGGRGGRDIRRHSHVQITIKATTPSSTKAAGGLTSRGPRYTAARTAHSTPRATCRPRSAAASAWIRRWRAPGDEAIGVSRTAALPPGSCCEPRDRQTRSRMAPRPIEPTVHPLRSAAQRPQLPRSAHPCEALANAIGRGTGRQAALAGETWTPSVARLVGRLERLPEPRVGASSLLRGLSRLRRRRALQQAGRGVQLPADAGRHAANRTGRRAEHVVDRAAHVRAGERRARRGVARRCRRARRRHARRRHLDGRRRARRRAGSRGAGGRLRSRARARTVREARVRRAHGRRAVAGLRPIAFVRAGAAGCPGLGERVRGAVTALTVAGLADVAVTERAPAWRSRRQRL